MKLTTETTLYKLLLACFFNRPMTSKEIYYIFSDFVKTDKSKYLNNAVRNGYFTKSKDGDYKLTKKALNKIKDFNIEIIKSNNSSEHYITHNLLLCKALFIYLLKSDLSNLKAIKKEKMTTSTTTPDLTLILDDMSLFIEIDTGTQIKGVIDGKLERYKSLIRENEKVIFFTKYKPTFEKYKDNQIAKFILIDNEEYQNQLTGLSANELNIKMTIHDEPNNEKEKNTNEEKNKLFADLY